MAFFQSESVVKDLFLTPLSLLCNLGEAGGPSEIHLHPAPSWQSQVSLDMFTCPFLFTSTVLTR